MEQKTFTCQICKKIKKQSELNHAAIIRPGLIETIKKKFPKWSNEGYICNEDLSKFRKEYIENVLELEKGELSKLDKDVIRSLARHEIIANNIDKEFKSKLSFGDRLSDKIAEFGGSWRFIITFGSILVAWIIINTIILLSRPFDPYPFILLNLILSTIAALQAPVIMMSQNRQEAKDRMRSEHDYKVNLKAELEIRHLHEKIDHLVHTQWQRLLEIQELQLEMMQERRNKK